MPVYEYQCTDCARQFELFVPQHKLSELVVCRHCHSTHVRKRVSNFASAVATGSEAAAEGGNYGGGCGGCGGGSCGSCGRH
jgi:putative FmdB family regulatory protein